MIQGHSFASAVEFDMHPMKNTKTKIKEQYLGALVYFLNRIGMTEHMKCRLTQYEHFLLGDNQGIQRENSYTYEIVKSTFRPWRHKYKFWLICDLALIVINYNLIKKLADKIKELVSKRQGKSIDALLEILSGSKDIPQKKYLLAAQSLIEQYRKNRDFLAMPERKIIVTANMSAGKSTLINTIMGKSIARTSQEVCTGNICYYYNKAFDDGLIHVNSNRLEFTSDYQKVKDLDWDSIISIALPFKGATDLQARLCMIDSPGVNSSIKREHGKIAKKCIQEEKYDILLYILNANKLGTDEEIAYLKWIATNVSQAKVIFVLNKLDDFRAVDDDIGRSIEGVRKDLEKLGYVDPIICPLSAYFAYLIKKNFLEDDLSEDEQDEYSFYFKKFKKPKYNLSGFYGDTEEVGDDYEGMLKRSGVYYLERMLYGGTL